MKITVNLDTQAVITQPSLLRIKAGAFVPVAITFTSGSQLVPVAQGTVIELAIKPRNQLTGDLLAYLNAFQLAAGNLYTGTLNCASESLLDVIGQNNSAPVSQLETIAEVTWTVNGQKFRSITFPVIIEAPITDDNPVPAPDPELYPAPTDIALKSDLATVATSGSYTDLTNKPTLGSTASHDASDFATAEQGAKADSAVQPGQLAPVATSGNYNDLADKPALGTASSHDVTDFASQAQGTKADTAVQPGQLATVATSGNYSDLTGSPVLGSAAAQPSTAFDASGAADAAQAYAVQRANHTGTQLASTISDLDTITVTAAQISDATPTGRALLSATDEAAASPNGSENFPVWQGGTIKQLATTVLASYIGSVIGATGSNRIVIVDRFSLSSLPTPDANGNQITEVQVGDVVHQTGTSGTPLAAVVQFVDHAITDDDVNNGNGIRFFDENGTEAQVQFDWFGGSGATVTAADLANTFANQINCSGLNAYANVTGDGTRVTVTSNTSGPLAGAWSLQDDSNGASMTVTEGTSNLPSGDFIVADLTNLGDAAGYQGIGDTVDFLSGYGAPTADIGEEGNGYVDLNNGDFYHRDASGWQFVLNIKGPQGEQGTSGKDGKDGTDAIRLALGDSTQIGTLLWNCKPPAYAVGTHPQSVCFDGTNIWVTNNGSNNVTKLTAATGTVVGTYSVGTAPVGICYDGTNIWVANSGSNNVTKLIASTGAAVGTYTVGTSPQYLCYDGTNIWVTNAGSNNVMRLTASTGAIAGTYATDANPAGICFDGTNIWVANCNYTTQSLSKFVAATGILVKTYSYLWNVNSPLGICFDGTNIWTANSGSFGVAKIVANTAAFVGEYFTDTDPPYWICFDGTYIWATYPSGTIRKILPATAAVVGRYKAGSGPRGICFDGTYLWVANYYDNTVSRL